VRRPFTLIELLVVVAIIAVLASLLLPALKRARATGLAAACTNNLRQCTVALGLYATDTDCYPVLATRGDQTNSLDSGVNASPFAPMKAWETASRNHYAFLVNDYAAQNPLYASYDTFNAGIGSVTATPKVPYFCPEDRYGTKSNVVTYAGLYLLQAHGHAPGNLQWRNLCTPGPQLLNTTASPADVILLTECSGTLNGGGPNYSTIGSNTYNGNPGDFWNVVLSIGALPNYIQCQVPAAAYTHPGGLNFAMLDGHVVRAVSPPHGIWGNVSSFAYGSGAMPVFDAKGLEPLR